MSVLVTGGAGYVGSHTVRRLVEHGYEVLVLDSLERGYRRAVLDAELVVGDITDRSFVIDTCRSRGVSQVVHFAAYKNVGESMLHPQRYWHNNVAGTISLLEAILDAGVPDLVFSSSCSVYGTPTKLPVDETAPIKPESVYAETKATVERILQWYGRTSGLRWVSLRYFNAAGASDDAAIGEDHRSSQNLIPAAMMATLGLAPPVTIFGNDYPTGDGTCIRDYIHVIDLADAHVRGLDHLSAGGASVALNLGTGCGTSVAELLAAAERVSGHRVPHEVGPRRAGDPAVVYADPSQAERVLGWRARYSLEDIVTSAWRWHSTHPNGFGS